MVTTNRSRAARESIGFLVVLAAVLVAVNVLGSFFFGRIDGTENKLFSLSSGSRQLAKGLADRMEISAYFTEDLPPPFNATERYVRDILAEYAAASGGKIRISLVHPKKDDDFSAAEADGVQRVSHQVVENDSVSVREGYRGLAIKYLGERRSIAVIEDTAGLEYRITQTIKELIGEKTKVGLVSGHEGPTLAQGLSALRATLPTTELREVPTTAAVPSDLAALLIVGPKTPFGDAELKNINAFVMQGKSLGVFAAGYKVSLEGASPSATKVDSGINKLIAKWGARVDSNLVGDWQCSRAPMRGPFGITVAVPYPAVPIVAFDKEQREHALLFKLNSAPLPFVSQVSLTGTLKGDKQVSGAVLARSSKNSWLITGDEVALTPRHPREWSQDGKAGPFDLAFAVEGKLPSAFGGAMSSAEGGDAAVPARSERKVRLLVVGSDSLVRDELLPPAEQGGERQLNSALALALNAIDWLSQDDDLIAIRAKNVEDPTLEVPIGVQQAEDTARLAAESRDRKGMEKALADRKAAVTAWEAKKAGYRWFNTLGIPALFLLYGLFRWRWRSAVKVAAAT